MIIVVGERPGPGEGRTTTSEHMARMIGVDHDAFMRAVRWTNVLDVPEPDVPATARAIESLATADDAIILLGRLVAEAFELDDMAPLSVVDRSAGPTIYLLPHPSGLNRWYNDPTNAASGEALLRRIWRGYRREARGD